jgi:hypothetical protein
MLQLRETINIAAPPSAVFGVMTDLGRYHEWNPWIVRASGHVAAGNEIQVTSRLGARRMDVRHRILALKPDRELRWCDLGWFTALAYGERARFLQPASKGTIYRVELTVTGIATRLVKSMFGIDLQVGLAAETAALKERVEVLGGRRPATDAPRGGSPS